MQSDLNPQQHHNRYCIIGEGDPFLARLLQRFAAKSGLQIKRALTGEDVLAEAQGEPPVLIILEPELPGKVRGWEAVRALQDDPRTKQVPVILCTWLLEADAQTLVGLHLPHLQKPDLHYKDFSAALDRAGVKAGTDSDQVQ